MNEKYPWTIISCLVEQKKNNLFIIFKFKEHSQCFFSAEKLQPSIKVKTIAIDFTKDKTIYRQMEAELRDLEIGVLVNNVGMAVLCEYFTDMQSEKVIDDMIACNILSVPRMIHMILPGMLQRKRGVILNIGSMAGATYTPLSALYGATKVLALSTTHLFRLHN